MFTLHVTLTSSYKRVTKRVEAMVCSLLEEADLDEDKKLSEVEFELMLSKSPDFLG